VLKESTNRMVVPVSRGNQMRVKQVHKTSLFRISEQASGVVRKVLAGNVDVLFVSEISKDGGKLNRVQREAGEG